MQDTKKLSRKFTLMFIAYFTAQIVFFGFWPSILRDFGYSDTFIGICIAAIVVVVIIGMLDSRGFF